MQALRQRGGLALERSRATIALADALERERLIAHVSLELRSRRDLDERAAGGARGDRRRRSTRRPLLRPARRAGRRRPVLAPSGAPTGVAAARRREPAAGRQPLARLRAPHGRDRRRPRDAGARRRAASATSDELTERGVRAVLATPIVAFERLIGVLGLPPRRAAATGARARSRSPRPSPGRRRSRSTRAGCSARATAAWPSSRRCSKAGEALTSDLRFDVVIERLVDELRALVNADAADCWTLLPGGDELVCRAVLGLPEDGGRPDDPGRRHDRRGDRDGQAGAAARLRRRPSSRRRADSYAAFAEVMDAPISSFGEIRGVLGVCSREAGRFEESDLRADRGVREPRVDRAPERRGVRGEHAAGARRARLLPDRGRARASRSREQETLDAVAQAAAEALGGDSCRRAPLRRRRRSSSPAPTSSRTALAAHLRERRARRWRALCARRQGARVPSAPRRRSLRRRAWRSGGGGRREARCWPSRSQQPGGRRRRARARLLPGRARVRRRAARARGARRGGRARRARAQRALRARARARAAGAAARRSRPRARGRARPGRRPRRVGAPRRAAARGRRCLGADARGRRGRRARGRRAGRARRARRPRAVDGLARRRHRPDARDAGDRRTSRVDPRVG